MEIKDFLTGLVIGIFVAGGMMIAGLWLNSLDDEINLLGIGRFVHVDAEPVEEWCEEWVCEAWAEPYCYFATPYPCSTCIEGRVPVDGDGNCPDGITKVTECVSRSRVWRRC